MTVAKLLGWLFYCIGHILAGKILMNHAGVVVSHVSGMDDSDSCLQEYGVHKLPHKKNIAKDATVNLAVYFKQSKCHHNFCEGILAGLVSILDECCQWVNHTPAVERR